MISSAARTELQVGSRANNVEARSLAVDYSSRALPSSGERGIGGHYLRRRLDGATGCRDCGIVRGGCADSESLHPSAGHCAHRVRVRVLDAAGLRGRSRNVRERNPQHHGNWRYGSSRHRGSSDRKRGAPQGRGMARGLRTQPTYVFHGRRRRNSPIGERGGRSGARLSCRRADGSIPVRSLPQARTGSAFEEIWAYAWKGLVS